MKKLILFTILIFCLLQSQNIKGKLFSGQRIKLSLVFHISREHSTYRAKVNSPDEKVFGITASALNFKSSTLADRLFQTFKKRGMATYATIEQTIDVLMFKKIWGWALKQIK
jgi:hypothetical protein